MTTPPSRVCLNMGQEEADALLLSQVLIAPTELARNLDSKQRNALERAFIKLRRALDAAEQRDAQPPRRR